jgi:Flp pilus assembly protein TadG
MLTFRRRFDDERGVTLVLMALIMVTLLGIAGLVVNIGLARADRQRNKSAADVAVTAGMRASDAGGGQVGTFRGACAALDYLKTNHPELSTLSLNSGWTYGGSTAITGTGSPCDSSSSAYTANYNRVCDTSSATNARNTFAWFSGGTGSVDVTVKAGYTSGFPGSDSDLDDFRDDVYHSDAGDPDYRGCDQLAVIVTERETSGFGKAVGAGDLTTKIRSVGRVKFTTVGEDAIALLLLERLDCKAVDVNGTTTFVRVKGTGTRPGIIHADSVASSDCNGSNRVMMGDHANGIYAEQAPSGGAPGVVSLRALATNPGRAYDSVTNVVPQGGSPTVGDTKGRGPGGSDVEE